MSCRCGCWGTHGGLWAAALDWSPLALSKLQTCRQMCREQQVCTGQSQKKNFGFQRGQFLQKAGHFPQERDSLLPETLSALDWKSPTEFGRPLSRKGASQSPLSPRLPLYGYQGLHSWCELVVGNGYHQPGPHGCLPRRERAQPAWAKSCIHPSRWLQGKSGGYPGRSQEGTVLFTDGTWGWGWVRMEPMIELL